jgi:hypothetical protein
MALLFGISKRHDFRVRLPSDLRMTCAQQNTLGVDDDAPYPRIRGGDVHRFFSPSQGKRHPVDIWFGWRHD